MRNAFKTVICLILILSVHMLCIGCQTRKPPEKAVLGLCLPAAGDGFEGSLMQEAREAAEKAGVTHLLETVSSQANGVIDASISELIEKKADAVILYAADEEQRLSAARRLADAKIPLILIGEPIDPEAYTALVTLDYESAGRTAGEAIAERLEYRGSILILSGPSGPATDAINRAFTEAIYPYADVEILAKESAAGLDDVAAAIVESRLQSDGFNAVFAHNDAMAIAASNVLKENLTEDVLIVVGKGGSPEAIDMLTKNNRYLKMTFYEPDGLAAHAIETALAITAGEEFEKDVVFPIEPVTAKNAAEFAG